jgi:hypothetical protein
MFTTPLDRLLLWTPSMKIDRMVAALLLALALTSVACDGNGPCPADYAVGSCSTNGLSCDYQEVSCTCTQGQWTCSGGPPDLAAGLPKGATCDPAADRCAAGLLCCPARPDDAGISIGASCTSNTICS